MKVPGSRMPGLRATEGQRPSRCHGCGANRPADQEAHQAPPAGRDRDHRPRRRGPGQRGGAGGVRGRRRVVNVAAGISGRYPNLGPQIIIEAGVPFIDNASQELFERVKDGDVVRLHEGAVYRRRRGRRQGRGADPRSRRGRHGRGPGRPGRADRGLRRQHDGVRPRRGQAAHRRRRRADDPHAASRAGTPSSWCAATTTRKTSPPCAPTSGNTGRCSSASTAAPTRCWRPATCPT